MSHLALVLSVIKDAFKAANREVLSLSETSKYLQSRYKIDNNSKVRDSESKQERKPKAVATATCSLPRPTTSTTGVTPIRIESKIWRGDRFEEQGERWGKSGSDRKIVFSKNDIRLKGRTRNTSAVKFGKKAAAPRSRTNHVRLNSPKIRRPLTVPYAQLDKQLNTKMTSRSNSVSRVRAKLMKPYPSLINHGISQESDVEQARTLPLSASESLSSTERMTLDDRRSRMLKELGFTENLPMRRRELIRRAQEEARLAEQKKEIKALHKMRDAILEEHRRRMKRR